MYWRPVTPGSGHDGAGDGAFAHAVVYPPGHQRLSRRTSSTSVTATFSSTGGGRMHSLRKSPTGDQGGKGSEIHTAREHGSISRPLAECAKCALLGAGRQHPS